MSNNYAEVAITGRAGDQNGTGLQITAGANFDALQLHREGATLRAPAVVAENNVTPAVFRPGEGAPHVEDVQNRHGGGREGIHIGGGREGFHVGIGVGIGNPWYYNNGAPYDYGYNYAPPVQCYQNLYGPPTCYPVVPRVPYVDMYPRPFIVPERRWV